MNRNIHTVYDRLEAKGFFSANPANKNSVTADGQAAYEGPVPFPRMLYHPQGKERIVVQAELVQTPFGPQRNNEQRQLINKIVNSQAEMDKALAEGWHEHPSDAIAASLTDEQKAAGILPPPKGAAAQISRQEKLIEDLQKELAALKAADAKGQLAPEPSAEEEE